MSDSAETNATEALETAREKPEARPKGHGQPGRSGPPGNQNARRHGLYTLKRAVRERGLDAIDGRSALGRALREYRADLVRDLGGEENLSAAEIHLVDLAVRDRLFLESLDAALGLSVHFSTASVDELPRRSRPGFGWLTPRQDDSKRSGSSGERAARHSTRSSRRLARTNSGTSRAPATIRTLAARTIANIRRRVSDSGS
jgi:hypothetical protein